MIFKRPKTEQGLLNKLNNIIKISENGCYEYTGLKNKKGYGKIRFREKHYRPHRLMYMFKYGKFSRELLVCHKCDNPSCINPDHLFLGTAKENATDRQNKGRGNNQYTIRLR